MVAPSRTASASLLIRSYKINTSNFIRISDYNTTFGSTGGEDA